MALFVTSIIIKVIVPLLQQMLKKVNGEKQQLPFLEEWSTALFIERLQKKEEMEKTGKKRDYGTFV